MLLNDFFTIENIHQTDEKNAVVDIRLNAAHPIFGGHFPEQAVVPGVCQIQMLTEAAGQILNRKLQLQTSSVTKFLAMIDPAVSPNLSLKLEFRTISEEQVSINGQLLCEETIFLKFKGDFK